MRKLKRTEHDPLRRGSLTVEAAMLAPVLLLSICLLLYLTAHVHNRACLYAGAAEQAVSGHERELPSYFAMTGAASRRDDGDALRTVRWEAGTVFLNGERWKSVREEATYKKYHPVRRIRQLRAAKKLAK